MQDFQGIISALTHRVATKAATTAAQQVLEKRNVPCRYLTTKEASNYLALSVEALFLWRQEGRGPKFRRLGRLVRYDIRDLDAWMEGLVPGLDGTFVTAPNGYSNEQKLKS